MTVHIKHICVSIGVCNFLFIYQIYAISQWTTKLALYMCVYLYFTLRKRKRRSDVVVVRGRLRLYSASGFFLLLGLVILAIGIGMATLGYWPHSESIPSAKSQAGGALKTPTVGGVKTSTASEGEGAIMAVNSSTSNDVRGKRQFLWGVPPKVLISNGSYAPCVAHVGTPSKQSGGALTRFLEQHRHSERMKMLGPFTMGIGIFIFICANAILHENRDRETKVRLS